MVKVIIQVEDVVHTIDVNNHALGIVRYQFNPSGIEAVGVIKALAAALMTEMMDEQTKNPGATWELDTALRFAQTASMWAVLGITRPKS